MCDTQAVVTSEAVWLAKNSDREPSEPQVVERHAPVRGDSSSRLRCTHVEIPQVPNRHGVIISRPDRIWGAEMGVNDQGVAIGNEAIFSRCASLTPGLLGMDLLRLGLERANSAAAALEVITGLLEIHGQGGPAGYRDRHFHYDNSFLVADCGATWVLETAGRDWVAKKVRDHYAISNALTLGTDVDRSSRTEVATAPGFAARFDTRLLPYFARARERRAVSLACLRECPENPGFQRFFTHLRRHARGNESPLAGSNRDLCLHACGPIRRSQTTGSMVVRLSAAGPRIVMTGTSAPCLSLYRPVGFDGNRYSVLAAKLWHQHERVHRRALFDRAFRSRLRQDIADTENAMLGILEGDSWSDPARQEADRLAAAWDSRNRKHDAENSAVTGLSPAAFFWRRLNRKDGIHAT